MDYLFYIRNARKLQSYSRGIFDFDDLNKFDMKFQDGKILPWYGGVEDVLRVVDLEVNDLSVSDHIDADEELSDLLNESEVVIFAKYSEI